MKIDITASFIVDLFIALLATVVICVCVWGLFGLIVDTWLVLKRHFNHHNRKDKDK